MTDPLLSVFPHLAADGYRVTSTETITYNCIAWAASRDDRWWWPHEDAYWPPGVPVEETVAAFQAAYATLGYLPCSTGVFEVLYEKIAVYATGTGKPTHAARQLDNGKWTSKLGQGVDIEHATPDAVGGRAYGGPVLFLKRRRPIPRVVRTFIGDITRRLHRRDPCC